MYSKVQNRQSALESVYRDVFGKPSAPSAAASNGAGTARDDSQLIDRIMRSTQADRFNALYAGDWQGQGYTSQSEADLALASILAFWTGPDGSRIDRLFRSSALMRGKWDERRGEKTYGAITIAKALDGRTDYYEQQNGRPAEHDDNKLAPGFLLSEVKPKEIDWLWPGYLPRGCTTGIEGDPGLGKSMLVIDMAARIASGKAWPDGTPGGEPAGVILASAEDDPERTVLPRLLAMSGDPSLVRFLPAVVDEGQGGKHAISLPEDMSLLKTTIQSFSNPALLVIDPLEAFLDSKLDTHRSHHVRRVFAELDELARDCNIAVIVIRHLSKDSKNTNPIYRGMGSIAFLAACRLAYLVGLDPESNEPQSSRLRILAPLKCNIGLLPNPRGFRIDYCADQKAPRTTWYPAPLEVTAFDLLNGAYKPAGKTTAAVRMLTTELAGSSKLASDMEATASASNIDRATLYRARKILGVETKQIGVKGSKRNFSIWWLPTTMGEDYDPDTDPRIHLEIERRRRQERKLGGHRPT